MGLRSTVGSFVLLCFLCFGAAARAEGEARSKDQQALDEALRAPGSGASPQEPTLVPEASNASILAKRFGSTNVRLMDLSLLALMAAGGSTEPDASIQNLQGGGHDPRKRGFTLQQAELSLSGAVDPYFRAEGHIVWAISPDGDSIVELEELFAATQSLPWGFEIKAGHYLTEFGRMNPTHAHSWDFMDQPVILTRIFGGDGQRAPGVQVSWLAPSPFYLQFMGGVQNANGETMPSFLGEGETVGGRPSIDRPFDGMEELVYFARVESAADLGSNLATKFGVSGLYGPNATGSDAETYIWGADFYAKWKPNRTMRGYPFVSFQSEFLWRYYENDFYFDPVDPAVFGDDVFLNKQTIEDYGLYAQIIYGFMQGWETGVRYEYATGQGPSIGGRNLDPQRDDRSRVALLLAWRPTEFSRLRLQANYDNADHLSRDDVLSVWTGLDFVLGTHPSHRF